MTNLSIPRPEHPRPDFMRDTFFNLNGQWQFSFDDENLGLKENWEKPGNTFQQEITVPFCFQSPLSGLGPTDEIHPILWYRRSFSVPKEMEGKNILLTFGAVDYQADVYVNGIHVGNHVGGYVPFKLDITHALIEGENDLCLRVEDYPDCTQPRGKQYWERGLMGCWYTPTSGIWQTVYLEAVGEHAIEYIHITPDVDNSMMTAEVALKTPPAHPVTLEMTISFKGEVQRKITLETEDRFTRIPASMIIKGDLSPVRLWAPGQPNLYDVTVAVLCNGKTEDKVDTYFGMRKIEVREGRVWLNNHLLYQRLILDQGYWPESLLTPPSDEAIQLDLQYTLDFGYNGARKHQKIEDPRYYYWADKMGILLWGEVPSPYDFTDVTVKNLTDTTLDFISRDFNHPSIIAWVPLNESWGVRQIANDPRQQATGRMLYHMVKAADNTRLCSTNDGWEQVTTDICALHDYASEKAVLEDHFASREEVEKTACDRLTCYAVGEIPTGKEAFMVTEYGGIAFDSIGEQGRMGGMETWGYHDKVADEEAFFERFQGVTDAIREIPYCQGYCYTQLTDVMQEINGVLSPDRKPKVDIARFKAINKNPVGK